MADNSAVLKEYLVALGFKIDQNSLNKLDDALTATTKAAVGFAAVMIATATAATAFVDRVATKMEDLYWSSVRLRDGAANIQDFQLSISKLGGDADGALSSLENFAAYLRTNPAGEGLLHNLGVQTRDAKGNLRSTIDMVKQFAHLPMPYWLKVRFAQRFGIDERSLQAIIRLSPQAENRLSSLYKRAGLDADKAAESSKDFKNELRDLEADAGVVAVILETRLLPAVKKFVEFADWLVGLLADLDQKTGGFSTALLTLTAIIWGVNFALRTTFGLTIGKMIAGLVLQVGLLAEALGAGEGVVGALLAISAAIEATPIGWIITAVALLGVAAGYVITHWDRVKAYFNSFVGWLRDKYNAVAKYLGLPTWTASAPPPAGGAGQDGGDASPQPDFRARERNLGANSFYGADQGGGGGAGATAALTGKALAFFQKAGWTANQAAGIVANLVYESGLKPNLPGDHGAAYGIGQWHKDRQHAFAQWAGHDIHGSSVEEQMAFVNYELRKGAEMFAGKLLAGATTAAQAGGIVSKYYERPADVEGNVQARGAAAARLVNNSKLAPSGGRQPAHVTIEQNNDFQIVSGADAAATARATGRELSRVNGDLTRNFAGASQ